MFKKKSFEPAAYESPVCNVIEVRLQDRILQVSGVLTVSPWIEDNNNPLNF